MISLPSENRRDPSRRQLTRQTVHGKLINLLQRADPLKRHAEKLINLRHAQSIRRGLNSCNFGVWLDYGNITVSVLSRHDGYNLGAGFDLDYTTGSKHQKRAELSRQKISALSRQNYNVQAAC
jgi:hypothetical protein